jgi:phage shock protein E
MIGFLRNIFGPAADFKLLVKEQGAVIIDVRTSQEFNSGHIKGAINIPLQVIDGQVEKIRKYNKPIITCCRSGARSGAAASQLKAKGIEAYNGGAWNSLSNIIR